MKRNRGSISLQASPRHQKGYSHLQSLSAIAVSAVLTGATLQAIPPLLDQVDYEVTRQAATQETLNQAIWSSYHEAKGLPDVSIPASTTYGFKVTNETVQSPLETYCYQLSNPLKSLNKCL